MPNPYQVGAYYFPNYHQDPRNAIAHGTGWTEWELVKQAQPRFPGHTQPKTPQWGYEDEADPHVMTRKIEAAASHGLNHFIFDWYWYNDGPFLGRALDEGFLYAPNNDRLKFALMWANHDWFDIHPAKIQGPPRLLYPGAVTRRAFNAATDFVIENYFRHPSYWRLEDQPYFSIYELMTLIAGLGGIEETRAALDDFRARTRAAGFSGLHLNAVVWGVQILPNEQAITEPNQLLEALGFDSVASYVWVHHARLGEFPATPYAQVANEAMNYWRKANQDFNLPYHPNVTMGWDASPRTVQSDVFEERGYPFMPLMSDNSPEEFQKVLRHARDFLDGMPDGQRILSINAWNEWTEGSYLEPDSQHGMGYLEAIRDVFGTTS